VYVVLSMPFAPCGRRTSWLTCFALGLAAVFHQAECVVPASGAPLQGVLNEINALGNVYENMYAKTAAELMALADDSEEQYRKNIGQLQALVWTFHTLHDKMMNNSQLAYALSGKLQGKDLEDSNHHDRVLQAYQGKARQLCLSEWLLCAEGVSDAKVSFSHPERTQAGLHQLHTFSQTSLALLDSATSVRGSSAVQLLDACSCRKTICEAGAEALVRGRQLEESATACARTAAMAETPALLPFVMRTPWPFNFKTLQSNAQIQRLARLTHHAKVMEKEMAPLEFLPRLTSSIRKSGDVPDWSSADEEVFFQVQPFEI